MKTKKVVNVEITPRRNESPERMIRRFIKKVKKERILEEVRDRAYYTKPSDRRRKEKRDRKRMMDKLRLERELRDSQNLKGVKPKRTKKS